MDNPDFADEIILLKGLNSKDVKAFSRLYNEYSEDLLILAYTILGNGSAHLCRKKVDLLFADLWEQNRFNKISPPIHNFLYSELRKVCKPE